MCEKNWVHQVKIRKLSKRITYKYQVLYMTMMMWVLNMYMVDMNYI